MKRAYFDCFSGASGDMILGALLDAGLDFEALQNELRKLDISGYELAAEPVTRKGIGGTKLHVVLPQDGAPQPHRHVKDIRTIIESSSLCGRVKEQSLKVFSRLAEAEAKVHRTTVEKVHFHEVGAVDSILDIVGAIVGLEALGIDEVHCSELVTGSGTVDCAHGRLPVPAPATAELIRGIPSQPGSVDRELLTPTGAAILTTLATSFGARPGFSISAVGYGAGGLDLETQPNLLRILIGEDGSHEEYDRVWIVETNLDDMTAEAIGYVSERLFAAGALDVFTASIQMKKSRPGTLLSVITLAEELSAVEELLLEETTTFGVRRYQVERRKLKREIVSVDTPHGQIRVKLGWAGDRLLKAAPEYDDCRRVATEQEVPFGSVYSAAARMAAELLPGTDTPS